MSDTVGFIRKLPHNLVASFRTTLSDITDADLIIKVVDISANDYKGHIATIENTLNYLKADKCPSILVFNKIDLLKDKILLKKINRVYNNPLIISTLRELMLDDMIEKIESIVTKNFNCYTVKIPHKKSHLIDYIYKKSLVKKRGEDYKNIKLEISCKEEDYNRILNKIDPK